MASGKGWNGRIIALASAGILILAGIAGYYAAIWMLKDKVVQALGQGSEVRDISVGWKGVEVTGFRIRSETGWPSDDVLRAERILLVPSLSSFFSNTYRIHSISITNLYISVYRTRNGKLAVVPGLISRKKKGAAQERVPEKNFLAIERIDFQGGTIEFFDANVSRTPLKIRFEDIQAHIRSLVFSSLNERSEFSLAAKVKGYKLDGQVQLAGWANFSNRDSSVRLRLRSVDLTALQPYLIKSSDTRVQKGTLDLDLASEITGNKLKAPGTMTISDLKLAPSKGMFSTFMGVPRDAVIGLMKDNWNRITLHFVLEGDIGNPRFSLRESLAQRLAVSMADTLKVSIGGVVEGAGTLGEKGVETATGVVKGIGGAVEGLFGGRKK